MACGEDGDVVKTIFLDLDNTLLDFDRAEAAALSKALERAGITPTADVLERYHELNAQHWKGRCPDPGSGLDRAVCGAVCRAGNFGISAGDLRLL